MMFGLCILPIQAQAALTTFATYSALSDTDNVHWQASTETVGGHLYTNETPGSIATNSAGVTFDFLAAGLSGLRNLSADYTFDAVASFAPAQVVGGFILQPISAGSFSFIYTGADPLKVGSKIFTAGANLLSGTFVNAYIVGQQGATAGSVTASEKNQSLITYSSDFIEFDNSVSKDFAINLTALNPNLNLDDSTTLLDSFDSVSGGAFSAEDNGLAAVVPEPASWLMLTMGFGVVGASARRKARYTTDRMVAA